MLVMCWVLPWCWSRLEDSRLSIQYVCSCCAFIFVIVTMITYAYRVTTI